MSNWSTKKVFFWHEDIILEDHASLWFIFVLPLYKAITLLILFEIFVTLFIDIIFWYLRYWICRNVVRCGMYSLKNIVKYGMDFDLVSNAF